MTVASMIAPFIAPSNPAAAAAIISRGVASAVEQASQGLLAMVSGNMPQQNSAPSAGAAAQDDGDDVSDSSPAESRAEEPSASAAPEAVKPEIAESTEKTNLADDPKLKKLIRDLQQTPKVAITRPVAETTEKRPELKEAEETQAWPNLINLGNCKVKKTQEKSDLANFIIGVKNPCPPDPSVLNDWINHAKEWTQPQASND